MVFKLNLSFLNCLKFENDVKIYGIQTDTRIYMAKEVFENDVKIYGIQTAVYATYALHGLRMM